MLEMLVRGKNSVGLSEVLAARRGDAGAPVRNPRLRAAVLASAGICAVLGALWLSLGTPGPVMNPLLAPQAAPASVAAGQAAGQTGLTGQSGPGLSVENISLSDTTSQPGQPGQADAAVSDDAAAGPASPRSAGVSLLPQRDRGPALREPVENPRPASQLQVDLPEQEPARAVLAPSEQAAGGLDKARRLALKPSATTNRP